MVLVGYDQEQHHSFRDFDDCEELRYLTLLVPLKECKCIHRQTLPMLQTWTAKDETRDLAGGSKWMSLYNMTIMTCMTMQIQQETL